MLILVSSPHLQVGFPSGLLRSYFSAKILFASRISPMRVVYLILIDLINLIIFDEQTLYKYYTYLLMELSPSWEATNCAATQELPSILWNPKVHHRVHSK
jgi:hypothetical protein